MSQKPIQVLKGRKMIAQGKRSAALVSEPKTIPAL
jgi:hypothetical protein